MSLNSDLASLQPSRMDSLLRFVRTFRKTLFNKKSGIQYAVNECCRDWWAEARNCRVLSGKPLPEVPARPEEYGNPHYVEARVDELEIWLEQSIKALKLDAEAEVLRSKLIAWSEITHRCRDWNTETEADCLMLTRLEAIDLQRDLFPDGEELPQICSVLKSGVDGSCDGLEDETVFEICRMLKARLITWNEITHRFDSEFDAAVKCLVESTLKCVFNYHLEGRGVIPPTSDAPTTHFITGKLPMPRGEFGGIAPEITGDNGPPPPEV